MKNNVRLFVFHSILFFGIFFLLLLLLIAKSVICLARFEMFTSSVQPYGYTCVFELLCLFVICGVVLTASNGSIVRLIFGVGIRLNGKEVNGDE